MSINYRKVDPLAVGQDVMKQRALELELRAYAMEIEVDCLVMLCETRPTDGALAESLATTRTEAAKLRRAAQRGAGAAPLTPEEVEAQHTHCLDQWLGALERTHASRSALLNEANRQLGLKGLDALNPDELDETEQAKIQLETELSQLESRHEFCLERIAALAAASAADDDHDHGPPVPIEAEV